MLLSSCSDPGAGSHDASATITTAKPDVVADKVPFVAITTSANLPGNNPALVADEDTTTGWTSGSYSPQWIQMDLGDKTSVSQILLYVNQFPEGPTTHEVFGGPAAEDLKLLGTLNGDTEANQWLTMKAAGVDVRFIKVVTVMSPSWVGWQEIEVYK